MNNFDAPQNAAERAENRLDANQNRAGSIVDMASPETRSTFQQFGEQSRGGVVESGQLRFDTTDIYGGGNRDGGGDRDGRGERNFGGNPIASRATALDAATQAPAAATTDATAPAATAAATTDVTAPAAPATTSDLASTQAAAASAIESFSAQAQAPAATTSDSIAAQAAAANLTPEQAAIAQSTVQLATNVLHVAADGTLSESTSVGTGYLVTGPNGEQMIATAGHVPSATGTDPDTGLPNYAEGPTTVTYADGTTTTAHVIANNTSVTSDNSVQIGNPADVALMSIDSNGPTLPHPSLPLDASATLTPGDTVNTVGYGAYGNGQMTGIAEQYLGNKEPAQIANNSNDTSSMLEFAGNGVHGMSGAAIVNSDGNVVGTYTQGTNPADGTGVSLDTPISNITTLLDGQSPFSPNYLYNLVNSKPQPIATPDLGGNTAESSGLSGATVTNGTTETYLDQPAKAATPPSSDVPTTPAPVTPSDTAAPAPVDTTAAAPTATDSISAQPTAQAGLDNSAIDTSAFNESALADSYAYAYAGDFGMDYGQGDF